MDIPAHIDNADIAAFAVFQRRSVQPVCLERSDASRILCKRSVNLVIATEGRKGQCPVLVSDDSSCQIARFHR